MATEQAVNIDDASSGAQQRQRSSISFPYDDLNSAVEMAERIHSNVGTGLCDDDQLAAWLDQSPKSSGFRTQIYAARMFGLISNESGSHRLTDLGRMIVDPAKSRPARMQSFLAVPLYKAVYDRFKGHVLPPTAAFERELANLGVSEKQKDKARQVLERSAEQAGFYESGRDRLIAPGVVIDRRIEDRTDTIPKSGGGGGGGNGTGDQDELDPLIKALFAKIPRGEKAQFDGDARSRWLAMIAMAFDDVFGVVQSDPKSGAS